MKKFTIIILAMCLNACNKSELPPTPVKPTPTPVKPTPTPIKLPQPQTVHYSESNAVIANPERGFQKYTIASNSLYSDSSQSLTKTYLTKLRTSDKKITVIYRYFLLDAFMDKNISSSYLKNMQKDFDTIQSAGIKTIVRFSYSDSMSQTKMQQPTKSRILAHINQLKPVLEANKEVLYSIQAGFIGTWGEFYYTGGSAEFGNAADVNQAQWNNRKTVIDAMLQNFPTQTPIQVRYPDIKTRFYGNAQLNANTADKNTPLARIGFYNDAFLNQYGDQGTFSDVDKCDNPATKSKQYQYVANNSLYLPMTGETNTPPTGTERCTNFTDRRSGSNAIAELDSANWGLINIDWYDKFWDSISPRDLQEINKGLGYRFVLDASTVSFQYDTRFTLNLKIKNKGFARALHKRPIYLVMKDNAQNKVMQKYKINTDVRTWHGDINISQVFDFNKPKGRYNLYLWMPDKATSLQNNTAYSVQLANQGMWNATTGYNDLLQEVRIGTVP